MFGVGITTFNGAERTATCIKSILHAAKEDGAPVEIFVIDDGSCENEIRFLRFACEQLSVRMAEHRRNQGISAGWNHLVAGLAQHEWVLVLNDDIKLAPGTFQALGHFITRNSALKIGTVSPWMRHEGQILRLKSEPDWEPNRPMLSLSPCGAAFLLNRKAWEVAGFFDETFKSFYEEYDFGLRLAARGFQSWHLPWPAVDHGWSQTFRQTPDPLLPEMRMAFSRQHFQSKWGPLDGPVIREMHAALKPPERVDWLGEAGPQAAEPKLIPFAECVSPKKV